MRAKGQHPPGTALTLARSTLSVDTYQLSVFHHGLTLNSQPLALLTLRALKSGNDFLHLFLSLFSSTDLPEVLSLRLLPIEIDICARKGFRFLFSGRAFPNPKSHRGMETLCTHRFVFAHV